MQNRRSSGAASTCCSQLITTCINSSLPFSLSFFPFSPFSFSVPACVTCCVSSSPASPWALSTPASQLGSLRCVRMSAFATACVCARDEHVGASNCTAERASGRVRVSLSGGVKQHLSLLLLLLLTPLRCKSHWGAKYTCACAALLVPTHTRAPVVVILGLECISYPCDHSEQDCCEIHTSLTQLASGECVCVCVFLFL